MRQLSTSENRFSLALPIRWTEAKKMRGCGTERGNETNLARLAHVLDGSGENEIAFQKGEMKRISLALPMCWTEAEKMRSHFY